MLQPTLSDVVILDAQLRKQPASTAYVSRTQLESKNCLSDLQRAGICDGTYCNNTGSKLASEQSGSSYGRQSKPPTRQDGHAQQ